MLARNGIATGTLQNEFTTFLATDANPRAGVLGNERGIFRSVDLQTNFHGASLTIVNTR
jgi:hypothetical protein